MNKFEKAFELIMTHLFEESGDGDARIECMYESKEDLANRFESWLKTENEYTRYNRLKRVTQNSVDKVILFSDMSNENVMFVSAKEEMEYPSWVSLVIRM